MKAHEKLKQTAHDYVQKLQDEVNVLRYVTGLIPPDKELCLEDQYKLIGAAAKLEYLAHECRLAIQEIKV